MKKQGLAIVNLAVECLSDFPYKWDSKILSSFVNTYNWQKHVMPTFQQAEELTDDSSKWEMMFGRDSGRLADLSSLCFSQPDAPSWVPW